jgi:signal peptidase I
MPSMGRHRQETGIDLEAEAPGRHGPVGGGWLGMAARVTGFRGLDALLSSRRYVVRGDSMRPTLESGHHLLVRRMSNADPGPRLGDLVIIRDPRHAGKRHLKRIVGRPGEEVRILDGMLFVDGVHLAEPFLGGLPSDLGVGERVWRLGSGEYFALGDNRLRSTDSREHGPISAGLIVGKVWLRYWPLLKWGRVS